MLLYSDLLGFSFHSFILATSLGTLFICNFKTGDAIRCKHQTIYCDNGLTCEYYYIIDGQT
jgi:hypothetical protein